MESAFKEQSKKFKSKIIEQKIKIENLLASQKQADKELKDLGFKLANEQIKTKELEISINKQEIEHSLAIENLKRHYEKVLNSKINEFQEQVQIQVHECKNYENEVKSMMEHKLKSMENKIAELNKDKEELMKQLASALEGLENLRNGYSEQMSISQNLDNDLLKYQAMMNDCQIECEKQTRRCLELENAYIEEQERTMDQHKKYCAQESQLKHFEENIWKLQEELEYYKENQKSLILSYENKLNNCKNGYQTENLRAIDNVRILEEYSKSLESQIQTIFSESSRNSTISNQRMKKSACNILSALKNELKKFKTIYLDGVKSLEKFTKNAFEAFSNKIIEKSAENRKLKSQLGALKAENCMLSQSVTLCSSEMDELSKDLYEKQKSFKDNYRTIKNQLKHKYNEKMMKLRDRLSKLEKENKVMQTEAGKKIDNLSKELMNHQAKEKNTISHKKCNEEIIFMEKRISELEAFLEAERSQKIQLVTLKDREIEEIRHKAFISLNVASEKNERH